MLRYETRTGRRDLYASTVKLSSLNPPENRALIPVPAVGNILHNSCYTHTQFKFRNVAEQC